MKQQKKEGRALILKPKSEWNHPLNPQVDVLTMVERGTVPVEDLDRLVSELDSAQLEHRDFVLEKSVEIGSERWYFDETPQRKRKERAKTWLLIFIFLFQIILLLLLVRINSNMN